MKKRILYCLLAIVMTFASLTSFVSCGGDEVPSLDDATRISFKSAASYEDLKVLSGKTVTINGYMATSSPVDGSFIFLMNLPYQSCPFCVPNTSQLSNTIEVYPRNGLKFTYTTQAVRIVGTLVVAAEKDQFFTDPYGYQFNFKIINADYTILQDSDLSGDFAIWQKIAQSNLINDLYSMYDYLNFVCKWNTYCVNTYTDAQGQVHKGYYLYPSDAYHYLTVDGAQWNYGYKAGYFDGIIAKIRGLDPTALEDLVENVEGARRLAERALAILGNGQDGNTAGYTYETVYIERFDNTDEVYTITEAASLNAEWERLFYDEFASWLTKYEM